MLGSIGKAGRVLDLFTPQRPEWGVKETALALGIPRSSAHDLLSTLVVTGLLRRCAGNRYRLGWKVLDLGRTVLVADEVRRHAHPVMTRLAAGLLATTHLAVLDAGEVVYVDKVAGRGAFAVPLSAVGKRLPPHCSAVGKVLLAHRPRAEAAEMLALGGMEAFTARTSTSVDASLAALDGVRARGWAEDHGEAVDGLRCVAAPVREAGEVVAALSVCFAASAPAADRLAAAARAGAAEVTRTLQGAVALAS